MDLKANEYCKNNQKRHCQFVPIILYLKSADELFQELLLKSKQCLCVRKDVRPEFEIDFRHFTRYLTNVTG